MTFCSPRVTLKDLEPYIEHENPYIVKAALRHVYLYNDGAAVDLEYVSAGVKNYTTK